jgi:hypothetical protein
MAVDTFVAKVTWCDGAGTQDALRIVNKSLE